MGQSNRSLLFQIVVPWVYRFTSWLFRRAFVLGNLLVTVFVVSGNTSHQLLLFTEGACFHLALKLAGLFSVKASRKLAMVINHDKALLGNEKSETKIFVNF